MSLLGSFRAGELYGRELISLTNYTPSSADGGQSSHVRFYGLFDGQLTAPTQLGSISIDHRTANANNAGRLTLALNDGLDNLATAQTLSSTQATFYVPISSNAGQSLNLGVNGVNYFTISPSGGIGINGIDNAAKFIISNAATTPVFTVNTTDATITIDGPASPNKFRVGNQLAVDTTNLQITLGTAGTSLYAPALPAGRLLITSPTNYIETTLMLPSNMSATNLMLTTPFMTVAQAGFVIADAGGALSSAGNIPFAPTMTGLYVTGEVGFTGANTTSKFYVNSATDVALFAVDSTNAVCSFDSTVALYGSYTASRLLQLDSNALPPNLALSGTTEVYGSLLLNTGNSTQKLHVTTTLGNLIFTVDSVNQTTTSYGGFFLDAATPSAIVQTDANKQLIASNTLTSDLVIAGADSATKLVIQNAALTPFFTVDTTLRRLTITGSQNTQFVGLTVENIDNSGITSSVAIRMRAAMNSPPYTTYIGNIGFAGRGFVFNRDISITTLANTGQALITADVDKKLSGTPYSSLFPFATSRFYATPVLTGTRAYMQTTALAQGSATQFSLALANPVSPYTNTEVNSFILTTVSDAALFEVDANVGLRYIGPTNPNMRYHIILTVALGSAGTSTATVLIAIGINNDFIPSSQIAYPNGNPATTFNGSTECIISLNNNDIISAYFTSVNSERAMRVNAVSITVKGFPYGL